jgi:hypothetical protein
VRHLKNFTIWTLAGEFFQLGMLYLWISRSNGFNYGTNDDAIISSIASGQLTGSPDPHWIFIQPILSVPLTWLQTLNLNINIYSLFLLIFTTLCFSAILGLVAINTHRRNLTIIIIFWILTTLTFVSWFAMAPTYTGASIYAVTVSLVAGTFIYLTNDKTILMLSSIILSISLVMAFAIRQESLYIFITLLTPLFVIFHLRSKNFSKLKFLLSPIVLLFIIFLLNNQVEKLTYNQVEWSDYLSTNSLRHQIQFRAPERLLESNYKDFNWDSATFTQFKNFTLADSSVMNKSELKEILEKNSTNELSEIIQKFSFENYIGALKFAFQNATWIIYLLAFQLFIFLIILIKEKITLSYLWIYFVFIFSITFLIYILSINYHVPERITVSILGLSSLMLTALLGLNLNQKPSISLIYIFLPLVLFFSFLYLNRFYVELLARQGLYEDRIKISQEQSKTLSNLNDEIVVISGASSLRFDWTNPYKPFRSIDPRGKTLILGWHNLSPAWNESAKALGLNHRDIYSTFPSDNILWASQDDSKDDILYFINTRNNSTFQIIKFSELGTIEYGLYKISN